MGSVLMVQTNGMAVASSASEKETKKEESRKKKKNQLEENYHSFLFDSVSDLSRVTSTHDRKAEVQHKATKF